MIGGSSDGGFEKTGAGTLEFRSLSAYSGPTTISEGRVYVAPGSRLSPGVLTITNGVLEVGATLSPSASVSTRSLEGSGSGGIELAEGALFRVIPGAGADFGGYISGAGNFGLINGSQTLSGAVTITGDTSIAPTANLTLRNQANFASTITDSGTLTLDNSTISGVISGAGQVAITGGVTTLSGANSYIGGTALTGATLRLASNGAAGAGAISAAASTIDYANGATVSNPIELTSDDALSVTTGAATQAGVISGAGALEKTGAGTLILTADNTYSGGTTVSAGTLQLGNGAAAGWVAGNIVNNGTVAFDRSDDTTYSNVISGTGALTKTGTGVLSLIGGNTYTGATTVSAGGLVVSAPLASSGISLASNTSLVFSSPDAMAYAGVVSGTGIVDKTGAGTLTLLGANTNANGINISAGKLVVSGSMAGPVFVTPDASFEVSSTGSAGLVTGSGATVANAGTITTPGLTTGTQATVSFSALDNTLTNSGVIHSYNDNAVRFGAGNDTLNLSTGTMIYGRVEMGGGVDTVNLAGSESFKSNNQVVAPIYGSEITNVNSGYWTHNTTLETDQINIASGATLDIDSTGLPPHGGAVISPSGDVLTVVNNGALIKTSGAGLNLDADTLHISGAGTVELRDGAVLQYGQNVTLTGRTTITDGTLVVTGDNIAGPFTVAGSGNLRIGAAYSDPDADGFVTIVSGGGATGSVTGDIAVNGGQVYFDRANDVTYAGNITGTIGLLHKVGDGVLTLAGSNTINLNVEKGGVVVTGTSTVLGRVAVFDGASLTVASTGLTGRVYGAGSATITNAGTIQGVTPLGSGYAVTMDGASQVNNSGLIRSYNGLAVRFGAEADTLNLSTGSSIVGKVAMGDGVDIINLAGSLNTKSATQSFGNIFESEALNVNSGYWTLTGEVAADVVSVAGGATFEIDDVGAQPDGAFISSSGDDLNIVNNGAVILNTADTRTDIHADNLHLNGAGTLQLTGGGTMQFGQNVTLTGATTVTDGTLVVTGDNIASPITVGAQGILRVGAAFSTPDVDGYVTIVDGGGTTGSLSGDVINNGAVIFDRADASTYAGAISGTGALTKSGAGALTLSGANTYTGVTTVNGGELVISTPFASSGVSFDHGGRLTFDGPGALTYAGDFSGNGMVRKTGEGVVALSGSITDAIINIEQGGLVYSGSSTTIGRTAMFPGTSLTVTSTGVFGRIAGQGAILTNAGTIEAPILATSSLPVIDLQYQDNTVNNSGVIRAYNDKAIRFGAGADTLNLSTGSSIIGDVEMGDGIDTINLAGTSNVATTAQVVGNVFGSEILNANSGYWTLNAEVEADQLNVLAGATLDIDSIGAAPGEGGFISANADTLTFVNNGAVILGTDDTRLDAYADDLHLSGSGTVELRGGGALQYGANVSLTGATTITDGLLVVTGDNIASPITVASAGTLRVGAAFSAPDVDGYVTIVDGGGTTGSAASDILNNGEVIFDRADASTYAGAMSGTGAVTKAGAGVLTLSGANTYTGATTVEAGGLDVSGSLASSGISLADGTNLTFSGSNDSTYAGVISGAVDLAKTGTGVVTLSGASTYTGATRVDSGGLTVAGAIASQSIVVADGARFTFGSAADQTFAGVVSGDGALGKSGAGTLTLTGVNTYAGGTSVTGGSLVLATTLDSDVTVGQGGTLRIGTGGTTGHLTGDLRADGTVIFDRSDDYLYAGAFSGDGSLVKRGEGLLTLDGLYTFSGTTTIEAGTIKITQLDADGSLMVGDGATIDLSGGDQTVGGLSGGTGSTVNINNASLTIDPLQGSAPTVFNGELSGDGALILSGEGVFDLAGNNTYTGPTTVDGGTLKVNGSITSPVTVNDGGTLGGSGTINGAVTIGSGGAISPGNSPGVQTIAGPLTLVSGATMIVEVDPTATITNDRINVTAGSATIAAGAKLDVRPLGAIANYNRVNDYTILTATGGVNGTFGANVTSTMALLTPSVSYSTNEVSLRLIRNDISFASLADTDNQAAVAAAAEGTGPSGAPYGALVGQDAAGARTGYDALSGELYGASSTLVIEDARHQRAALLGQAASSGVGAWARAHDGEATIDAAAGAAEAKGQGFGVAGGGQVESGGWNLGFGLAYGKSDIDVAARASASDVETLRAGVYAGRAFGAWRVRVGADAARHDFDAKRGVVFPTVSETVAAKYDGSSRQLFGELAYAMDIAGGSLEPFVELAGVQTKTDAFRETGGTLGLDVAEGDRTLTFATVGARYSGAWAMGSGSVRPQVSVAWRRAGGDVEGTSTAAFGTSSFTVVGASIAKDAALIDAGVGFDLSKSISGSVSYSGALSSDAKDHAFRAGLFVRF